MNPILFVSVKPPNSRIHLKIRLLLHCLWCSCNCSCTIVVVFLSIGSPLKNRRKKDRRQRRCCCSIPIAVVAKLADAIIDLWTMCVLEMVGLKNACCIYFS